MATARFSAINAISVAKGPLPARRQQAVRMPVSMKIVRGKDANFPMLREVEGLIIPSIASSLAAVQLAFPDIAQASGREDFGLLAGRTVALVHPLMMGILFFGSVYSGYLGWQWRRTRTIGAEISELKKQVPAGEEELSPALKEVQAKIETLTSERAQLVKGGYRDKHHESASLILGLGVAFSVAGATNTWMRTGKLFPGPHLFAGAGITALWAIAAAMVPAMQKGNDTARYIHISCNAANALLFAWQIPTGLEIVNKVFQFTTWP